MQALPKDAASGSLFEADARFQKRSKMQGVLVTSMRECELSDLPDLSQSKVYEERHVQSSVARSKSDATTQEQDGGRELSVCLLPFEG